MQHNIQHVNSLLDTTNALIRNYKAVHNSWEDRIWRHRAALQRLDKLTKELKKLVDVPSSEQVHQLTKLFEGLLKDLKNMEDEEDLLNHFTAIWDQFSIQWQSDMLEELNNEELNDEESSPPWKHLCRHLLERLQEDTTNALVQEIKIELGFLYENEKCKIVIPDAGLGHLLKKACAINGPAARNILTSRPSMISAKALLMDICQKKSIWPLDLFTETWKFRDSLDIWQLKNVVKLCEDCLRLYAIQRQVSDISIDEMKWRINKFLVAIGLNLIQPVRELLGLPLDLEIKEAQERIFLLEVKIVENELKENNSLCPQFTLFQSDPTAFSASNAGSSTCRDSSSALSICEKR